MQRRTAILALASLFALVLIAQAGAQVREASYGHTRHERYKPPAWRSWPHTSRRATIYGTPECDSNSPSYTTADGTDLHRWRPVIASNEYPLGTLIRFDHHVLGHLYFRVHDTGGGGAALFDVFGGCPLPSWTNPTLHFRVRE